MPREHPTLSTRTPPPPQPLAADEQETSPLGEYLDEVERSFDTTLGSPLAMDFDATIQLPSTPLQRRSRSPTTWASTRGAPRSSRQALHHFDDPQPSAGPSRVTPSTPPARQPLSPPTMDNEFADRFKYLVATSGLLEKTQIASLSPSVAPAFSASGSDSFPSPQSTTCETNIRDVRPSAFAWRWDMIVAFIALVMGLFVLLDLSTALMAYIPLCVGAAIYGRQQVRRVAAERSMSDSEKCESHEEKDDHIPPQTKEQQSAVHDLEELLSESKSLDQCIAAALRVLSPHPNDTEHAHELRIALHRLFDDMTDSLAGATSALTPMADRGELAVLGEMYDIQVLGGQQRRKSSSEDDETARISGRPRAASTSSASLSPEVLRTALLSPHERVLARTPIRGRVALGGTPTIDKNDKFTKLPERMPRHKRASWSTDWSTRSPLFKSGHESRFDDEAGTDMSMSSADSSAFPPSITDERTLSEERMPAIPDGREASFDEFSPTSSKSPSPFSPKRASPLAQALARLEAPDRRTPNPFIAVHKSPASQSPFRRSLQDIPYIPSSPASNQEKAASMAIARASASMPSDKRRSLQIPTAGNPPFFDYAREQALQAAGVSLARTKSLDNSEKARLHRPRPLAHVSASQRTSPGSSGPGSPGLKRLSLLSDRGGQAPVAAQRMSLLFAERPQHDLGLGASPRPPFRPPMRVPSVSPLTLGGLKAACLGVHHKRRRMACCLLGLHFNEPADSEYWADVNRILRDLASTMAAARAKIDALRADAERETTAAATMDSMYRPPPFTPPQQASSAFSRGTDFAPRDTSQQAALASLDEVQRTLARVWARCEGIRTGVISGDDLSSAWADARVDIGSMLRHVDRGRAATEMDTASTPDDSTTEPDSASTALPEFVRAWAEPVPGPGPEEIERLVDDEDSLDTDDSLPLPGVDEVFEGTAAAAAVRQRSALSREERIALTREARARGMTLAQLEAKADPERAASVEREMLERSLREASGQMVAELEGMFGAIRRRKGMVGEGEGEGVGFGVAI